MINPQLLRSLLPPSISLCLSHLSAHLPKNRWSRHKIFIPLQTGTFSSYFSVLFFLCFHFLMTTIYLGQISLDSKHYDKKSVFFPSSISLMIFGKWVIWRSCYFNGNVQNPASCLDMVVDSPLNQPISS